MRFVLLLGVLAGCIQPRLVECGDLDCPSDRVCDALHRRCISQDQLDVCVTIAPLAPCASGDVKGFCLDGVCLASECGDGFVEPGEACDDGNFVAHDGCNATCTSLETCGNGVLDDGEACDDGNRMSRDGCDSTCHVETTSWTIEGLGPVAPQPNHAAYDPNRHQVIHVDGAITWAWDGDRWLLVTADGPPLGAYSITTDRVRGLVLAITSTGELYEWDGTAWTHRETNGVADVIAVATYAWDGTVIAVSAGATAWSLDVVGGVWTQIANGPFNFPTTINLAFDATRGVVVEWTANSSTEFLGEWNGSAWHTTGVAGPPAASWLVYDPGLATVLLFSAGTPSIQTWNGGSLIPLATPLPSAPFELELGYDAARSTMVLVGTDGGNALHVYERSAGVWSRRPDGPGLLDDLIYDPFSDRVRGSTFSSWWEYDTGTWRDLAMAAPVRGFAYDPIRGGIVSLSSTNFGGPGTTSAFLYRPTGTTPIPGVDVALYLPSNGNITAGFDAAHRRIVLLEEGFSAALSSDSTTVTPLTGLAPVAPLNPGWKTVAFDAGEGTLTAVDRTDGHCYELDGATWVTTLSPGPGYRVIADQRRGTVEFFGARGPSYLRRGNTWIPEDPEPYPLGGGLAYVPTTGEVIMTGRIGDSALVLRRSWTSPTALEQCGAEDTDGDGLVGCDDPDCFAQCAASCPPYATCLTP